MLHLIMKRVNTEQLIFSVWTYWLMVNLLML